MCEIITVNIPPACVVSPVYPEYFTRTICFEVVYVKIPILQIRRLSFHRLSNLFSITKLISTRASNNSRQYDSKIHRIESVELIWPLHYFIWFSSLSNFVINSDYINVLFLKWFGKYGSFCFLSSWWVIFLVFSWNYLAQTVQIFKLVKKTNVNKEEIKVLFFLWE